MELKTELPLRVESKAGKSLIVFVFFTCLGLSLWFTPLPNAPEEPCDRPCHELEWPRICRLKFVLESHNVPFRNCNNDSHCLANGFEFEPGSNILAVNRLIPGPTIHVCVHDIVLVNVVNRIPDRSISIHWRGQCLRKNPLMDGVSMVSQCPITSYTTFQYKFRASDPGTHMWQLHNGEHNPHDIGNIYGLFIVRQSVRQEPHRSLVDQDESSHRIVVRGFKDSHQAAILVNGNPQFKKQGDFTFEVNEGKRYRFRTAHSGGNVKCAITVSVERHTLVVIALDGNPVEPVNTTQFTIVAGERLDFILQANQSPNEYKIKFSFVKDCELQRTSFATIRYSKEKEKKKAKKITAVQYPEYPLVPPLSTRFGDNCGRTTICLEDLRSLSDIPAPIVNGNADKVFYLVYGYQELQFGTLGTFEIAQFNNITFVYPSSPLASQRPDVPPESLCNENMKAEICGSTNGVCECTHVIDVEVGSVVELVLVHKEEIPKRDHTFHLHGHKFYVLERQNAAEKMSSEGRLKWRSKKPVMKDTLSIPRNGSAVVRFQADNIGYWLLQEEGEGSQGMQVVFNVIGEQYDVPDSFPRCGNWVGPKYFLA